MLLGCEVAALVSGGFSCGTQATKAAKGQPASGDICKHSPKGSKTRLRNISKEAGKAVKRNLWRPDYLEKSLSKKIGKLRRMQNSITLKSHFWGARKTRELFSEINMGKGIMHTRGSRGPASSLEGIKLNKHARQVQRHTTYTCAGAGTGRQEVVINSQWKGASFNRQ